MAGNGTPPSFEEFDRKLDEQRRAHAQPTADEERKAVSRARMGSGFQVGIELVAGVGAGLLIGWGLDSWLGTSPWLLVICFFLGSVAGMMNAVRWLRRAAEADDS